MCLNPFPKIRNFPKIRLNKMAGSSGIDLNNVQGDILSGLPKKAETFFFFEIDKNVDAFRARLQKVVPLIASDKSVSTGREKIAAHRKNHSGFLSVAFANISFSAKGLQKVSLLLFPRIRNCCHSFH